jgi:hypothetical protein
VEEEIDTFRKRKAKFYIVRGGDYLLVEDRRHIKLTNLITNQQNQTNETKN